MESGLLDRLETWKSGYGSPATGEIERLLAQAARTRVEDAGELIRLHETLLFLRAYPHSAGVAHHADRALAGFGKRVEELRASGADLSPLEEAEVSGIAGSELCAVFGYETARHLARRHARDVEIGWDRYDEAERMAAAAERWVPLFREDWPVEAHPPLREWVRAGKRPGVSDLAWLLGRVERLRAGDKERGELYGNLEVPVLWKVGTGREAGSRSLSRLPDEDSLFCHGEPLLRRRDLPAVPETEGGRLPVRRVEPRQARCVMDLILDTSAVRLRELYGFSHPDLGGMRRAELGRGVALYFFGVPPEWRLPLRAYHAGMFFKNGVPAGYVELLSLFERAEIGFNLYYTFREGESAWLYLRLLRLFREALGVTCFSVDPYQIGHENREAVESGAFWFYRKLGFRPVDPGVAALLEREERRLRQRPGYRSSRRTLERLAEGYILYESDGTAGAWDAFRVRNVGMAAQRAVAGRHGGDVDRFRSAASRTVARELGVSPAGELGEALSLVPDLARWTRAEKVAAAAIVRAKQSGAESRYLRLMQAHGRMRAAFLALGRLPGHSFKTPASTRTEPVAK